MVLADRDGRAVDVVVAGGDRAPADRRVAAIARVSSKLITEATHPRGLCGFGARRVRYSGRQRLFFVLLLLTLARCAFGQESSPEKIAAGVWFLIGDASKGYSNTAVIEMKDYLIVVDANYPGRAKELLEVVKGLSTKPVRYVFDTHAHGDHAYGNSVWTRAGATTMAFRGVANEMNRWEPARWQAAMAKRDDVRETGEGDVQRPRKIYRW
jgi:hypothetical protein